MGYSNKEKHYWEAQSLADDFSGEAIETRYVDCGVMVLSWTDAAATDAQVKIQEGFNDGNWHDITGMSKTIGAASGTHIFKLTRDLLMAPYIRAVIVDNSESAGTAVLKYYFKGGF